MDEHHRPRQDPRAYSSPEQPVAFDQHGNPLYAHPQRPSPYVHEQQAFQPVEPEVPPEIMKRHHDSLKKFPNLNLTRGEYVISTVKRHPIGLLRIWAIAFLLVVAFAALILGFLMNQGPELFGVGADDNTYMVAGVGILVAISALVVGGALVATYVYNSNRFYLTNESVIQEIQTSVFSKFEQTVSLSNIEDASYKQPGIIASFFNYGTIRLSTEGDETTYRFTFVARPKHEIAVLNNAIEAFKYGRPIYPPHDDQAD